MNETRRNLVVGLFVLVGLAAMGALIVLFGQQAALMTPRDGYVIEARFTAATGIRPGTVVTIGGIDVGRVRSVDFVDRTRFGAGVRVVLSFDRDVRIRRGSFARTVEPGVGMGRPPIVIVPGPQEAEFLASGSVIPGEMSSAMTSLIPPEIVSGLDRTRQSIEAAAAAMTPVLEDLHELLRKRGVAEVDSPDGPAGNISTAVARLDSSLKHFNTVLGDPGVQSNLKTAIANIHKITEDGRAMTAELKAAAGEARQVATDARALVADAQGAVKTIDENVQRVARRLMDDLEAASRLLDSMHVLTTGIGRGEGTIGRLMTDPRLYDAMTFTFQRLGETAEEFKLLVMEWQKGRIRVGL